MSFATQHKYPHKKVNSLEYLRGDKEIKVRKLQIDEVFIKKEVIEDVDKEEPSGGAIRKREYTKDLTDL